MKNKIVLLFLVIGGIIFSFGCDKEDTSIPIADFSASSITIYENDSVTFTDNSSNSPTSWSWNFGDGGSSSAQNPVHCYKQEGIYTVSLDASNQSGSNKTQKTDYITVSVKGFAPEADFIADKTSITEGENVQFTDQSTNSPISWSWDFGDGTSGTEQNPTHIYTAIGVFSVTLTVSNEKGSNSIIKESFITVNSKGSKPVADFSANKLNIIKGWEIQFTDKSTNTPTSWKWDFGDGTASIDQNATHSYENAGLYTVSLLVSNNVGNDSIIKSELISVYNLGVSVDFDGNFYDTVVIGTQTWMSENLKTKFYNDGTPIPYVAGVNNWANLTSDAYCWQNDDEATYKDLYGALYSYYVVETENICPVGWHVPSYNDWSTLINYLTDNGYGYEGTGDDIAKSLAARTTWSWSDMAGDIGNYPGSNNSSGFSAVAGGKRFSDGLFASKGARCNIWSSTEKSSTEYVYYFIMWYSVSTAYIDYHLKTSGHSIRCLKD
jgi:uncharacterized protein (TIGR02145 family)